MKLNKFKYLLYFFLAYLVTINATADARTDVRQCLDLMKMEIRQGWVGGKVYVDLESFDGRTAFCSVEFKNGPERRTRKATIEPEASKTLSFSPSREVIRMKITVRCADSRERLKDKPAIDESCRTGSLQNLRSPMR